MWWYEPTNQPTNQPVTTDLDTTTTVPLQSTEHFIEGEYIKYNSNAGFVAGDNEDNACVRNTPNAFSHFTFAHSDNSLLIIDIQGVSDLYTDPQIHTIRGSDYGVGNLGLPGMALFFHSHNVCHER
jgi:elongation factor 2 kinase